MEQREVEMGSRMRTLIIGGVAGAALGVAAAWLFVRSVEEEQEALALEGAGEGAVAPRSVGVGPVVRLGISILGVLRQIVDLGREE
jgi:hypothetical protein